MFYVLGHIVKEGDRFELVSYYLKFSNKIFTILIKKWSKHDTNKIKRHIEEGRNRFEQFGILQ